VPGFGRGARAGTSVGPGGAYRDGEDVLGWSKGGVLRGQSPPRIAFLRKVLEEGPPEGLEPIDKWQDVRTAGKKGEYYLVYFGKESPREWAFALPAAGLTGPLKVRLEVLDTWAMTVTPVPGTFELRPKDRYVYTCADRPKVPLPGTPYVALRIRRVR